MADAAQDNEFDDLEDDALEALKSGEIVEQHDENLFSEDPPAPKKEERAPKAADSDDEEEYSAKVQKRIGKLVSQRKLVETERDTERDRRTQAERERDEALARLAKYEERQDSDLTSRAEDLVKRRDAALDDGDLTVYNQLNDELMEVRLEMRERKKAPRVKAPDPEPQQQPRAAEPAAPKLAQAAKDWLDRNSDWIYDPSNRERAIQAQRLEAELISEGYYYDEPELYQELDRRLGQMAQPTAGDGQGIAAAASQTRQTAQAGTNRDSLPNTPPRDRNPAKLTRADLDKMARYGLDPQSPKDRKAWLQRDAEL